jgi:hypothetical protein
VRRALVVLCLGAALTGGAAAKSPPNPLVGEAASAAAGDIPDNQVFLLFHDATAGYSIRYPEGWARSGNSSQVVFRDKNNIVRVVVDRGRAVSAASVRRELATVHGVRIESVKPIKLPAGSGIAAVYETTSPPNPVTGKRVTLVVDRYEVARNGKLAIVDLGTPVGVDNVDAYRLIIDSFRWR